MDSATGFTKARMDQMSDDRLASCDVVGENLILTREDSTQINAGNVKGPPGDVGSTGEVSQEDVDNALAFTTPGSFVSLSSLAAGWTTNISAANEGFGYVVDDDRVRFEGYITRSGANIAPGSGWTEVYLGPQMPVDLRPTTLQAITCFLLSGDNGPGDVRVYPDGYLRLFVYAGEPFLTNNAIYFSGSTYYTT